MPSEADILMTIVAAAGDAGEIWVSQRFGWGEEEGHDGKERLTCDAKDLFPLLYFSKA